MVLRVPHIAWILECNPGMPCLEQHAEHFPPELLAGNYLVLPYFSIADFFLIFKIFLLELAAIGIMEIRNFLRREESPCFIIHYALHEQVRNPVCCVHVMG